MSNYENNPNNNPNPYPQSSGPYTNPPQGQQPYTQYPQQQPSGPYQQPPNYPQQPSGPYQQPPNYPQQPSGPYQQPPNYPQQPSGPYQQPPVAPKKKRGLLIVGLVLILIVAVIACIVSTAPKPTASTSAQPASTVTSGSTAPASKSKPAAALTWQTVQTFTGNGSKKTATFTAPSTWRLLWTCNHASFQNLDYNVIATVEDQSGAMVDAGVNATCKSGSTSGETDVTSGGTVRLDVISEGDWSFKVQEQK